MAKDPSMPFYVNDWLSSPRVRCLTLEMRGAFLELLCYCWSSQDASIPDDDEQLAVLSGLGDRWNTCSTGVRRLFEQHPTKDGFLTNRKVYDLWSERANFRQKKSEAGRASGASRRKAIPDKEKDQTGETNTCSTGVQQVLELCSNETRTKTNSSSSSSSSSIKDLNIGAEHAAEAIALTFPQGPDDDFKKFWSIYPRKASEKPAVAAWPEAIAAVMNRQKCNYETAVSWLISKTREFAASPRGLSGKAPYPDTWLLNHRFFDDPAEWMKNGSDDWRDSSTGRPGNRQQTGRYQNRSTTDWDDVPVERVGDS